MNSNEKEKSANRTLYFRFALMLFVIMFVFIGIAGYCYRSHIIWIVFANRHEVNDIEKIPNYPMPIADVPEGWQEHSLGNLKYFLPEKTVCTISGETINSYHYEGISFYVTTEQSSSDIDDALNMATKLYVGSDVVPTPPSTMPLLILCSFSASTNDFSWSMSQKEVNWLMYVLSLRSMIVPRIPEFVEYVAGESWDGILIFTDKFAIFQWYCFSDSNGGYGNLCFSIDADENEKGLDVEFIRIISQNIKPGVRLSKSLNRP